MILASVKCSEGKHSGAMRQKVTGRGRSALRKPIKDDLSEEVTFKVRLEGWEGDCRGRKHSQGQDSEAGAHPARWRERRPAHLGIKGGRG